MSMAKRKKHTELSPMQALRRAQRASRKARKEPFGSRAQVPELLIHPLMNMWAVRSVAEQPEIELARWRVFEVGGKRVFFGYSLTTGSGRRSSAIVSFDLRQLKAVTASGRVYRLVGPPGYDDDAQYLLELSSLAAKYTDVTDAACRELGISQHAN